MTTALHDLMMGLPAMDRDAMMKTLISDDFSRRFEIQLGLEPEGRMIVGDLYASELLRLPGKLGIDDAIDTLSLGFYEDEQLTGRYGTPLTRRELRVIDKVLAGALLANRELW